MDLLSDVCCVLYGFKTKHLLQSKDIRGLALLEDVVDVVDNQCDIRAAVLGHILLYRRKVRPLFESDI